MSPAALNDFGLYYDREGAPIGAERWGELFMDMEYKVVRKTAIWNAIFEPIVEVSTVWLGMNHNWTGTPPIIFETMIFGGKLDEHQWRYATEAEAIVGHEDVVRLARLAEKGEVDL